MSERRPAKRATEQSRKGRARTALEPRKQPRQPPAEFRRAGKLVSRNGGHDALPHQHPAGADKPEGGAYAAHAASPVEREPARITIAADGMKHPHSTSLRLAPLPLPGGEERSQHCGRLFLSPVERGRGGLRSKTERGSNSMWPSVKASSPNAAPRCRPNSRAMSPARSRRRGSWRRNSSGSGTCGSIRPDTGRARPRPSPSAPSAE